MTSESQTVEHQTVEAMRFDHVALASRHAWDHIIRYCYQLGGTWIGGPGVDDGAPFYFGQVEFVGGTKLELLEPVEGAGSDFLRRFLDRNGPGPHHITFKVADFDQALEAVGAAGYDVVGIDRSDPDWQEAFLHPKQSHGIVIQLACPGPNPNAPEPDGAGPAEGQDGEEHGWINETQLPPALRPQPTLSLVEHLVADLEAAVKLFTGPLAMTELDRQTTAAGPEATLTDGPWRLKLVEPAEGTARHWLGNRPGRLWALHLTLDEPATVPGAHPLGDGRYELPPRVEPRHPAPPPPQPTVSTTPASGVTPAVLRARLNGRSVSGAANPVLDRRAAVAAVFRAGTADTELLFIQRATFEGDPWSGQMAFPGGRVEPSDPDTRATAERETLEELALDLSGADPLGSLNDVDGGRAANRPIQVSAHCYWLAGALPRLQPNYEVAAAVWVPIGDLLDRGRYIDYFYRQTPEPFPGIQLDHPEQVIWGLTLRFLADLFVALDRPFII